MSSHGVLRTYLVYCGVVGILSFDVRLHKLAERKIRDKFESEKHWLPKYIESPEESKSRAFLMNWREGRMAPCATEKVRKLS